MGIYSSARAGSLFFVDLTFNLAKLAPSRIKAAGIDMAPINAAVSMMNAKGGFPSGALGTRSPVQFATGTNRALSGEIIPHGIAMAMDIETGVARSRIKLMIFFVKGVL